MWDHEFEGRKSHRRPRQVEGVSTDGTGQASHALAALVSGRSVSPSAVHHLQRAAGNAAVADLLDQGQERSPVLAVIGKGGGKPLDGSTRSFMESRMGRDFSDVRVHTDARAAESARSVHARAYTVGNEIVFDDDSYDPTSAKGRKMLAHELTHVGQQSDGEVAGTPVGGGIRVSDPADRFEHAAETNAERVMSGPTTTSENGAMTAVSNGASLQRDADEEADAGSAELPEAATEIEGPDEGVEEESDAG